MKHLPTTSNPLGEVFIPGIPLQENTREFTIKNDLYVNDKNHIMVRGFFQNFTEPADSNQDWLVAFTGHLDRGVSAGTLRVNRSARPIVYRCA